MDMMMMIMILLVVLPKMQALCNHTEQASDLSLFFPSLHFLQFRVF